MIYLIAILSLTFYFLVKWNVKISRELKRDRIMFKTAMLRREVISFLRNRWDSISKSDGRRAVELIDLCSFTISHHKDFYESFKLSNIKIALIEQKKEVDVTEENLIKVHNKTIKSMYTKFGILLIENIKDNTLFFRFTLIFAVTKWIATSVLPEKIKGEIKLFENYLEWLENRDSNFSKYREKYQVRLS